ncbi:hypothetical protein [Streptomyces collinus]|uniref:hypothetical protein n=1 Tax=Streptomyces collinus TaxID=42684 RepID=UPI00363A9374
MPALALHRAVRLLVLLPALAALPAGTVAAHHATAAPAHACPPDHCTPIPAAAGAAENTDTLALRPGAHLAPAKIRALTSPAPALRQTVQNLTRRSPATPSTPAGTSSSPSAAPPGHPTTSAAPPPSASAFAPPATPGSQSRAPSRTASLPTGHPQSPAAQPATPSARLYHFLGVAAVLAALLATVCAAALTRRRRRPAARPAPTARPQPATPSAESAAGAERDSLKRVDQALRTLAHHHTPADTLPALSAARITADALHLLPRTPGPPPLPATPGPDGWWTLAHDTDLLPAPTAQTVPAPCPALVPLGTSPQGDLLLLNLAELPALLLDGTAEHITEVCTSLLLEYTLSPLSDDLCLITAGLNGALDRLPSFDHILHTPTPPKALHTLAERLLETHQQPDTRPRAYALLSATALDTDTATRLARLKTQTTTPLTVIAPAPTARNLFTDAEILDASALTPQPLGTTGTDITLQRLTRDTYEQLTALLPDHLFTSPDQQQPPRSGPEHRQLAPHQPPEPDEHRLPPAQDQHGTSPAPAGDSPLDPAPTGTPQTAAPTAEPCASAFPALTAALVEHTPARGSGPSGTEPRPAAVSRPHTGRRETPAPAADDTLPPQIRVLGTVEVDGVSHSGHGPRTAQLAALLYFRPGRTADAICADMDPATPWTTATLGARLHQLRRALGDDPHGNPYVPRRQHSDDPYRLHPGIRCDWTDFHTLTEPALAADHPGNLHDLEAALALVRGRPFSPRPLPWAEPYQQEMVTRIVHTAYAVARLRTPPGPDHNLTAARDAIATGLDIDHTAEQLYRAWMSIEAQAGNRSGLHTAISRLQHVNAALGSPLAPETEQLIHHLLHSDHSAAR